MSEKPRLSLDRLRPVGTGLKRPECVLCLATGELIVSRLGRGVERIGQNGDQRIVGAERQIAGAPLIPNGIALTRGGDILIANIGDGGGVWKLAIDGSIEPFLIEFAGEPLPPVNFVMVDDNNRIWVTVSTRQRPRHLGYRPDVSDGYIILIDGDAAPAMIADGLHYTNEVRLDPSGDWLYVSETMSHRITRMRLGANGSVLSRETFVEFDRGDFVDGIAFDAEGGLWAACIVSSRIYRVDPSGSIDLILSEADTDWINEVETAYASGKMARAHFDHTPSTVLRNPSSLAFGGGDLKLLHIGSLSNDCLLTMHSPFPGLPLAHWNQMVS